MTGKTRKEAQAKLRRILADADQGVLPPAEKVTLAQHLERWLEDEGRHSRRPRTHENYAYAARCHILLALGGLNLTQLQPAHVQKLCGDLLDRGLSPKTVRIVHGVLRAALTQAVDWNLVPRNVAALARPPRARRKDLRHLDAGQARRLQDATAAPRWAETNWPALIALALSTGMRQGELLGLTWDAVDLDAGRVHVRRQLGRDKALAELKTGTSRRAIDLPPSTVAALRAHHRRQAEWRLAAGPAWRGEDLVFCTREGKPLSHRNVSTAFKALLRRANLPAVPFHALRHTNATLLLLAGEHPKVVQERLGHATIGMTLDLYSHVLPGLGRAAAAKLETLLG